MVGTLPLARPCPPLHFTQVSSQVFLAYAASAFPEIGPSAGEESTTWEGQDAEWVRLEDLVKGKREEACPTARHFGLRKSNARLFPISQLSTLNARGTDDSQKCLRSHFARHQPERTRPQCVPIRTLLQDFGLALEEAGSSFRRISAGLQSP